MFVPFSCLPGMSTSVRPSASYLSPSSLADSPPSSPFPPSRWSANCSSESLSTLFRPSQRLIFLSDLHLTGNATESFPVRTARNVESQRFGEFELDVARLPFLPSLIAYFRVSHHSPDGELKGGKGKRLILASTVELHARISTLEQALHDAHCSATGSTAPHPLLASSFHFEPLDVSSSVTCPLVFD